MGLFSTVMRGLGLKEGKTFGGIDIPNIVRPSDVINEILGVEAVEETYTKPDGTKGTRLVTRTNLSPEEQARVDALDKQYDTLLADFIGLAEQGAAINSDYFQPVLQAVKEQQAAARTEAFKQNSRLVEDTLASRGLSDSQAAKEQRASLNEQYRKQAAADEQNRILLAEQLRDQQMQRTGLGLEFTANQRQQNLSNLQAGASAAQGTQLSFFNSLNSLNLNRSQLNLQNQLASYNSQVQAQQNQLSNLGGSLFSLGNMLGGSVLGNTSSFGGGWSSSPMSPTRSAQLGITWN